MRGDAGCRNSAGSGTPCLRDSPPALPLRPVVAGPNADVSAGYPLTSAAAFATLLKGGNAFDAGVAALLVGGVVEQDFYRLGGDNQERLLKK
jgi:gamma-glutamyltranspeptidase/glutathione hydrolase